LRATIPLVSYASAFIAVGLRSLDDFSDVIWINSGQRQYPF